MSSLIAFIRQYNYLRATAPMGAGGQCVDLAQLWYTAQGGPDHVFRNATQWAGLKLSGHYWVPNADYNHPAEGDIVVWGQSAQAGTTHEGHIAVCVLADKGSLLTFDQDWPWGASCQVVHHPYYAGVLGWHTTRTPLPAPQRPVARR